MSSPGHSLRWICLLPIVFGLHWLCAGLLVFVFSIVGIDLQGPSYPAFLHPFLFYLASGFVVSFMAGMIAPSKPIMIAGVLALICVMLSIYIHIVTQTNCGLTNYMHVTGETVGAAVGVGLVIYISRRRSNAVDVESST